MNDPTANSNRDRNTRDRPQVSLLMRYFFNRTDCVAVVPDGWRTPCPVNGDGIVAELIQSHLYGGNAKLITATRLDEKHRGEVVRGPFRVGSYAPDLDDKTRWLVIDIDGAGHSCPVADPLAAALAIKQIFESHGFIVYLEKSGGGHGWHLWVFFKSPIAASKARRLACALIPRDIPLAGAGVANPTTGKGIEIFPKSDRVGADRVGTLVYLPAWYRAREGANQFHCMESGSGPRPYTPDAFEAVSEEIVDQVLLNVETPRDQPRKSKSTRSSRRTRDEIWKQWRIDAISSFRLEDVYGDWVTGERKGEWLVCRDPESPSGDQNPSAGVADGSGKYERGTFHSFRDGRTLPVFDFVVERGRAADIKDAFRIIAELSGVPFPKSAPPLSASGLPQILVNNRQLREVVSDAWKALHAANGRTPILFRRADHLVRLGICDGTFILKTHNETSILGGLMRAADWTKRGEKGITSTAPPKDVARDLLEYPDDRLPVLNRVIRVPVFAASGELIRTGGYHAREQIYLDVPKGFDVGCTPANPTAKEIEAARALIVDDLLCEFPFVGDADRAHIVAAMLLPFVRLMISGCTPLHSVESPTPGSGKGLICKLISIIAEGSPGRSLTLPVGEDDTCKKLTAELRDGRAMILLDNAPERRRIESASLASVLTSLIWSDRILKESRIVALPNQALWLLTANNPSYSMEIARRTIRCRINPGTDQPWLRSGFRHVDIEAWALTQRSQLVAALLTLISAWIAAGRPIAIGAPRLGSFEDWSDVIGGILATAGIPGFLMNVDEFYASGDAEGQMWREFVGSWYREYGEAARTISDLTTFCESHDLMVSVRGEGSDRSQQTRLGMALQRARDRVFGQFQIVLDKDRGNKGKSYKLISSCGQDTAKGGTFGHEGNLEPQRSPQGTLLEVNDD